MARSLPYLVKPGVDIIRVHPQLQAAMGYIGARHLQETGFMMTVTSAARDHGQSYHNPWFAWRTHQDLDTQVALAFDMRRWSFRVFEQLEDWVLAIKSEIRIGALIEPEWMTPEQIARRGGIDNIVPHVHWQLSKRYPLNI